jgi:hypothetical protein
LDKECSSFERDFLSELKIFPKPIACASERGKISQLWEKRSSKEPIPYPKLALVKEGLAPWVKSWRVVSRSPFAGKKPEKRLKLFTGIGSG